MAPLSSVPLGHDGGQRATAPFGQLPLLGQSIASSAPALACCCFPQRGDVLSLLLPSEGERC